MDLDLMYNYCWTMSTNWIECCLSVYCCCCCYCCGDDGDLLTNRSDDWSAFDCVVAFDLNSNLNGCDLNYCNSCHEMNCGLNSGDTLEIHSFGCNADEVENFL